MNRMWKTAGKKVCAAVAAVSLCLAGVPGGSALAQEETGAMGRYVESDLAIPEDLMAYDIVRMDDGNLRIAATDLNEEQWGLWDSSDGGESWELAAALPEEYTGVYFTDVALSSDGGGAGMTMEVKEGISEEDASVSDYDYYYVSFDGAGNARKTKLDGTRMYNYSFAGNGLLTSYTYNGTAALIDRETGAETASLAEDGVALGAAALGESLLITDSEVLRYDAATGEPLGRDEALAEALFADNKDYSTVSSGGDFAAFADDGERLYYCTNGGVYAHTLGESAVEQVVNGSLTSLNDTSLFFRSLAVLDECFYILVSDSTTPVPRLLKFQYDPDTPAVPQEELTVYSLEENQGIRQQITRFQKENPEVYVNYEVGMSGEDGVTASDALRTLNTDILAGNGPDVLILDGLSVETYAEKGVLADLSGVLEEVKESEGLLENIAYTYQTEDGVYAVPTKFSIPVAVGSQECLDRLEDVFSLPELAKEEKLLSMTAAVLDSQNIYYVCAGSWKQEDNTLDAEKLRAYVEQVQQTYQNYMEGLSEEDRAFVSEWLGESFMAEGGQYMNYIISGDIMGFLAGEQKLSVGLLTDILTYSGITSLNRELGDISMKLLKGQEENVFVPTGIISVLDASKEQEQALQFVQYVLSAEGQMQNTAEGFPVNQKAFQSILYESTMGENTMSAVSTNTETGEMVELIYSWPSEEELKLLEDMAEQLTVRADLGAVQRETVLEETKRCMDGEISVDEAVNTILQKINLYLAE